MVSGMGRNPVEGSEGQGQRALLQRNTEVFVFRENARVLSKRFETYFVFGLSTISHPKKAGAHQSLADCLGFFAGVFP